MSDSLNQTETIVEPAEPKASENTTVVESNVVAPKKKTSKKKIIISIGILLVVALALTFVIFGESEFEKVQHEVTQIVGFTSGDGDYFTIDTLPDEYENMDPTIVASLKYTTSKKALEGIKYANEALGFNGSLYSKMMETTALMGRQYEENDKYMVSWKYHPDDGLEVTYEKK